MSQALTFDAAAVNGWSSPNQVEDEVVLRHGVACILSFLLGPVTVVLDGSKEYYARDERESDTGPTPIFSRTNSRGFHEAIGFFDSTSDSCDRLYRDSA